MSDRAKPDIVVLISGSGSNLQSLIDSSQKERHFNIAAVISNQADAYGLERAKQADIPALCLDHKKYADRYLFDQALVKSIDTYHPDLLALAGFMRILNPEFVHHYRGRAINIHPSLLPKYRGLHTHRRVLEAGDSQHGCSIHLVTDKLDGGPLIIQSRVPVLPNDSEEILAKRVLKDEHIIYPLVVNWYAQGKLKFAEDHILFDGKQLEKPIILQEITNEE